MRGALRIGALVVTSLLGVVSGIALAGQNIDPVGTVTSLVSSVGGQTTVVSSVVSTATESVDGALSGGGGGGKTGREKPTRIKTMFDRLPRRFEVLLERIEVGQKVGASMRRLERALADAPPRLRARVLRLVRAEIRRLQHGGVSPAERGRLQRLHRLERVLTQPGGPAGYSSGTSMPPGASSRRTAPTSTSPSDSRPFTGSRLSSPSRPREPKGEGGDGSRLDRPPEWESRIPLGVLAVLLVLLFVALIALLLAAVPAESLPRGRLRRFVRRSRIGLAVTGAAMLIALALILFL